MAKKGRPDKTNPKLKKFFENYDIPEELQELMQMHMNIIYGQILFQYVIQMVEEDALGEFEDLLNSTEIPDNSKILSLFQILRDHLDLTKIPGVDTFEEFMEKFYDSVVTLVVSGMEKQLTTIKKLYKRAKEETENEEEMNKKFLEYIKSLDELQANKFKSKFEE